MKYAWITKHKKDWPVALTCDVLSVGVSGYFEHCRRNKARQPGKPGANPRLTDSALLVHIKAGQSHQISTIPHYCPVVFKVKLRQAMPDKGFRQRHDSGDLKSGRDFRSSQDYRPRFFFADEAGA